MSEWEWYTDANTFRVFFHLVLTANYEDKKWQGITIKRGQRVSSYDKIAKELKLSVKQVRIAIDKLKKTNDVAIKSTNRYSVFTVVNYNKYQDDGRQNGKQRADRGQTDGKQRATIKEVNNIKEDKKGFLPDGYDRDYFDRYAPDPVPEDRRF
jgi:hypothetical protein